MPRAIIIYATVTGNTKKTVEAIGEVLNVDIKTAKELINSDLSFLNDYELIGLGSGIYYFKHHPAIIKIAEKMPELKGKKCFIFSTAGFPIKIINHRNLRKILRKKGLEIVGEFSCRGFDENGLLKYIGGINKGHPNKDDIEMAKKFARRLLEKLASH